MGDVISKWIIESAQADTEGYPYPPRKIDKPSVNTFPGAYKNIEDSMNKGGENNKKARRIPQEK